MLGCKNGSRYIIYKIDFCSENSFRKTSQACKLDFYQCALSLPLFLPPLPISLFLLSQVDSAEKWTRVSPLPCSPPFGEQDATRTWFLQKSSIHVTLVRPLFLLWLRGEGGEWGARICLGMKLGLRAVMARQALQRVLRGGVPLAWHPRWVRLDHHGEKDHYSLLSPPGDAASSELGAGPPNRWAQQLFTHGTCAFGAFARLR